MKVLVTGGRGFIGRSVCALLSSASHEVTVFDNGWRSDAELPEGVRLLDQDIRDRSAVADACMAKDLVVHLAAIQGTGNFYRLPEVVLDVNVRGVLNVVDGCAAAGVRRLLFSSSSEVYGVPTAFPTPETAPLQVPDPLNPRWSYGGSKIVGELAVVHGARTYGFEFTILRYHNVYGPAMGWDHVIPQFIRRLELQEEFTVQGDGEQRRSFCYVDDAASATVAAAVEHGTADAILNIGNPAEEVSINELVGLLEQISGREIERRYIPLAGEGTRRRLPDVTRARELLGFDPRTTLRDGLRRTYEWYARELVRERLASGA